MKRGSLVTTGLLALGVTLGTTLWRVSSTPVTAQSPGPHIEAVYVNSANVTIPAGSGAAEASVTVEVPVPADATSIVGWKMSTYCGDRTRLWGATVFLQVNGENYDHYKNRESGQGPPHFLPAGLVILVPPSAPPPPAPPYRVDVFAKFFHEDPVLTDITAKANAWVWFLAS